MIVVNNEKNIRMNDSGIFFCMHNKIVTIGTVHVMHIVTIFINWGISYPKYLWAKYTLIIH